MNRDEKGQVVATVVERLERTEAVVTADFRGLTVAELAELRGKLREADAEMSVVKNTLSRRAADQTGRSALLPYLSGPTGLVWVNGDPAKAAKVLSDFSKAHPEVFTIRGGVLGADDLPAASIVKLASLPSREQMLAQLAGGMIAPISKLAGGLSSLIGTMARTLAAVRDSGSLAPGEAPVPAASEESAPPQSEEPTAESAEIPAAEADEAPTAEADEAPAAEADEAPAAEADEAPEAEAEAVADAPVAEAEEPGADTSPDDAETTDPVAEAPEDEPQGESESPEADNPNDEE